MASTSALDDEFIAAQTRVKTLSKTPNPEELLSLYALYKQATSGDVNGARPSMIDFKGRAKYDAWAKQQGVPADAAKQKYVALVGELAQRYS
jgi:diazepam-binding inhibitor (GABA receptor modulator, acyl-CoA-binding protein)